MLCLIGSLVFLEVGMSYFPFVWVAVGVIVLYKARYQPSLGLSIPLKIVCVLFGLSACVLAFSMDSFRMPEVSLLLSGLSIIFFAVLGFRGLIIPTGVPIVVSLASRFIRPLMVSLIEPLVKLTFLVVSFVFGLFVEVQTRDVNNVLSFKSVNGVFMNIGIDNSCSGIWSLGAFVIAMFLVLIVFPYIFREWILFFSIGFAVTYFLNIVRIVFVCFVGYYTGSYEQVMFAHTHIGWILFTIWMIVFWYFFISEFLKDRKSRGIEIETTN